jgi:hypothetical protein
MEFFLYNRKLKYIYCEFFSTTVVENFFLRIAQPAPT